MPEGATRRAETRSGEFPVLVREFPLLVREFAVHAPEFPVRGREFPVGAWDLAEGAGCGPGREPGVGVGYRAGRGMVAAMVW